MTISNKTTFHFRCVFLTRTASLHLTAILGYFRFLSTRSKGKGERGQLGMGTPLGLVCPITHQLMEEPGERVSCVEGYGSEVDGDSSDVVW